LRLALRLGDQAAHQEALDGVADAKRSEAERLRLLEVLGQLGRPGDLPTLLQILKGASTDTLRGAALAALQTYAKTEVYATVLALYPQWSPGLRGKAQTLLTSRPESALLLLKAVDNGKLPAKEIGLEQLRRILVHKEPALEKLVEKHWGKIAPATAGEKLTQIRNVQAVLQKGKGDLMRGKALFTQHCATCHTLFGQGNKVGPDLTTADRKSRDFLVSNIVDPSAIIRPEFAAYVVVTTDGRILTGLVVEATPQAVTLLDAKNERTKLPRDKIDTLKVSPVSLMPEKLLDGLTDQQLSDLFSYLQADPSQIQGVAPRPRNQHWPTDVVGVLAAGEAG
jgi:putative heme-binding domain-containing protein